MKKQLEILKLGTASRAFGASAQLVSVRDGIARTYDGTTSASIPLDMADCQFMITPVLSAVSCMEEPKIEVTDKALIISAEGRRVRVPTVLTDMPEELPRNGDYIDIPTSALDALAHVGAFCGVNPQRPFTVCVNITDGFAYGTNGYIGGRYPVGDKSLSLTIETKTLAPLLKLDAASIRHNGTVIEIVTEDGGTVTAKLSAIKYPDLARVFSAYDYASQVEIKDETKAALRTAGSLFLEDETGSVFFGNGTLSTSLNLDLAQYSGEIQDDIGEGAFSYSRISRVITLADRGFLEYGEPCFFSKGDLSMMAIGLRKQN